MKLMDVGLRDDGFLLDLLNTTPVAEGMQYDVLKEGVAAKAWLREHAASDAELPQLIAVRDVLQAVVRGTESPVALEPLLNTVAMRATATADGLSWTPDGDGAARGAVRAILAWDALQTANPGRLRACANPDCRLFLIDRSKPNTARWCSMATCGNQMKARRHYRRVKNAETDRRF